MANKFKKGDIVIGNNKANSEYSVTVKGWIGRIMEVIDNIYILEPRIIVLLKNRE